MIEGLKPILDAALTAQATVYDHDTGPDASGPAVWITDAPSSWGSRMVNGPGRTRVSGARLVCVSSSALGAGRLAAAVSRALDGHRFGDSVLRCVLVTEAVEDQSDPTDYRWTATVDVAWTHARG